MQENDRKSRVRMVTTVVTVVMLVFGIVGGVGFASDGKKNASKSQYGNQYASVKRMAICHKGRTIVVSGRSAPAHLRHGDVVGPCAVAKKKHGKHFKHGKVVKAKVVKVKVVKVKVVKAKVFKVVEVGKKAEESLSGRRADDSRGKGNDSPGKSGESHGKGKGKG